MAIEYNTESNNIGHDANESLQNNNNLMAIEHDTQTINFGHVKKIKEKRKEKLPKLIDNIVEIRDSNYEDEMSHGSESEPTSENDSMDYINYNKLI